MADDRPSLRSRPWKRPPETGKASAPHSPYRFVIRLLAIPALAVCGVFLYRGIHDRVVLPDCDSDRAKKSIAEVLQQLKLEPTTYAPIKTVSSTKDEVACSAVMPLPGGGYVNVAYRFYWQGDTAQMKYSVSRKATADAPVTPPLR
jgi:hypothetical protein